MLEKNTLVNQSAPLGILVSQKSSKVSPQAAQATEDWRNVASKLEIFTIVRFTEDVKTIVKHVIKY